MKLPLGYRYAAVFAGIRKVPLSEGHGAVKVRDDLALILSDAPASAAAVFTRNRVVAAPVELAKKNLRAARGKIRAVLVNAGNANCATRTGERVALECVLSIAQAIGAKPEQVLPASTGVIGVEMDARLVVDATPQLVADLDARRFEKAASAILTTDTCIKTAFAEMRGVRLGGMTKGSGMIHPRMATTLGFVMTDAAFTPAELRMVLKRAIARSYNRISVDGDTSTNDMVAVLANGASGVKPPIAAFEKALTGVLESLAQQIVRDGEGARKMVTIDVSGAPSDRAAEQIARAIANSPLVKTAVAGSDPNWGRILSSAGNAGVAFDPARTDIDVQGVRVCRGGVAADFAEDDLKNKLGGRDCHIRFAIRGGRTGNARFWTCDLTEDYIRINASYRT